MSEMVERVAEALFNFEGDGRKFKEVRAESQVFWRDAARAVLWAIPFAGIFMAGIVLGAWPFASR